MKSFSWPSVKKIRVHDNNSTVQQRTVANSESLLHYRGCTDIPDKDSEILFILINFIFYVFKFNRTFYMRLEGKNVANVNRHN